MTRTETGHTGHTESGHSESILAGWRALGDDVQDAQRRAASAGLDACERAIEATIRFETKVADATEVDWIATAVHNHAEYARELAGACTSVPRSLL